MPLKLPLIAQNVHQQRLRSAGRFAVDAVVRAHDALHLRFLHRRLERGQIRLVHVLRVRHGIEGMADGFRAGVHREMLGARGDLEVLAIALQALDEPYAQPAGKIRIFTICLMTAAPARVTEDVDVRAPQGQALVNVTVAVPARATPCRDSFHQLYAGMPSRGMAGESKRSWEAFSSSVICATSSCASRRASSRFIIGTFLLSFSKGFSCTCPPKSKNSC